MASAVLFGLAHGQLDAFADAIEAAKADIEAARLDPDGRSALATELERFVGQCELIPLMLRHHCDSVMDLVAAGAQKSYAQLDELRRSFRRGQEILDGILELAEMFQGMGESLKSLQTLESARAAVVKLEGAFFGDHRTGVDVDDAFAQIRGVTREDWLKQVAARKALIKQ